jgi:hypothetical protein
MRLFVISCTIIGIVLAMLLLRPFPALGHDMARPDLTEWYKSLRSGKGYCCDGSSQETVHLTPDQWRIVDGHYEVFLNQFHDGSGESIWVTVPDDAVIHEPNLAGETIVWPIWGSEPRIRCFLPGDLS